MPTVRIPDHVVFRSFGNETVVLNLSTGQYHGVRGVGGRMLEVLAVTRDLDEVALQIAEEYEYPVEEVSRDLIELCAKLAERSLIELDEHP
jgi:hypothetical protein